MNTQKLHDLIDKVIGKTGPLRTPAWWMRKVLNDLVSTFNDVNDNILLLESYLKALIANCIKSIPTYTYSELKELKDKNLLIPGQKYCLTDYMITISYIDESELSGEVSIRNTTDIKYIILTANTTNTFFIKAHAYNDTNEYEIDFHFDRNSDIGWCLRNNEKVYTIIQDEVTFYLGPCDSVLYNGSWHLVFCPTNSLTKYIVTRIDEYLKKIYAVKQDDKSEVTFSYVDYRDDYRGCITRMRNLKTNVDLPFDHAITFTFDITVHDEVKLVTASEAIADNEYNIYVEPYFTFDSHGSYKKLHLPRVKIRGTDTNPVHICGNCTSIYIEGGGGITLRGRSSDVYLRYQYGINTYLYKVMVMNDCNIAFLGNCGNCVFKNEGMHYGSFTVFAANNLTITSNRCNTVLMLPRLSLNSEHVTMEVKGDVSELVYVSRDSNGNIRQWNPADYVDAIDEQVTIEEE